MPMEAMDGMPDMAMPFAAPWVFAMWWVMMLGMMLPSAAPMILMYDTLQRRKRERDEHYVPTTMFVAGYLIVWGAFSVAATAAQWSLLQSSLLSPMLALTSPVWGGVLFILAGIYQLTPFKYACLRQCRSPFAFVLNHWRDGWSGALRMGAGHGLYCLGCCWVLMALLFAVGVMNLRMGGRDRGVRVRRESCCPAASGSVASAAARWQLSGCGCWCSDRRCLVPGRWWQSSQSKLRVGNGGGGRRPQIRFQYAHERGSNTPGGAWSSTSHRSSRPITLDTAARSSAVP